MVKTPKRRVPLVAGAALVLVAALAGCSSPEDLPATSSAAGDPPAADAATPSDTVAYPAGPEIAGIDLCTWVNTSLAAMNATFAAVDLASADRNQTLHASGTTEVVTCDIRSSGTDSTGHDETIGRVTLVSGGEPAKGAGQHGESQPYEYFSYSGLSVVVEYPPAAMLAVQLEAGLVLNIEGFREAGNQEMDLIFNGGVQMLAQNMLEQRDMDQVYDLAEGSHAEAEAFCASLGLARRATELGVPEGLTIAATASGEENWGGNALSDGGPIYTGTRTCGLEAYSTDATDLWSWNSPLGKEEADATFTFYAFPDAATAADAEAAMTFGSAVTNAALGSWVVIAGTGGLNAVGDDEAMEAAIRAMAPAVEAAQPPTVATGD